MNIALVLQHKLLLGIQRFMHGTTIATPPVASHVRSHASLPRTTVRSAGSSTSSAGLLTAKAMPLRVLRVVESGMPRSSTGRMVISGRMADVCAELDRLAEREAALH